VYCDCCICRSRFSSDCAVCDDPEHICLTCLCSTAAAPIQSTIGHAWQWGGERAAQPCLNQIATGMEHQKYVHVSSVLLNGNSWGRHCVCAGECGSSMLMRSCTYTRPVLHLISGYACVSPKACNCISTSLQLWLQGRARATPATQAWTRQIQQPCTTVRGCTLLAPTATPSPPQSSQSPPGPHHRPLHNQVSLRM